MNNDQYNHEQPPSPSKEASLAALPLKPSAPQENAAGEDKSEFAPSAIEFRNVEFSYDDSKVLDALSFQVAKGEALGSR